MPRFTSWFGRTQTTNAWRRERRLTRLESLEIRRLLTAEGAIYEFNKSIDGAGLPGEISAVVSWGDGTTSTPAVIDTKPTSRLRFKFDYSLDSNGFFSGSNASRREVLQIAGDLLLDQLTDTLSAISPANGNTWTPNVWHPSRGSSGETIIQKLPENLKIAANEIVVYVGSRNLPGDLLALGGPGGAEFNGTDTWLETIQSRGQSGALKAKPTDFAPTVGSLSFDSDSSTNWYFGLNPDGIGQQQIDFLSVAIHELCHVLGFGTAPSWQTFVSGNAFTGTNAKAAAAGRGNVALAGGHFDAEVRTNQGATPLGVERISAGSRHLLSSVDLAALNDIGWKVGNTSVTVKATHRFADDGKYPVEVLLQGREAGQVVGERKIAIGVANITNVVPTLEVAEHRSVPAERSFSITDIGVIADPGFRSPSEGSAATETFRYQIDWGDGSEFDTGTATIDRPGKSDGTVTLASFDGTHRYLTEGTKTIKVRVEDDDGGVQVKSFTMEVTEAIALRLSVSSEEINEDAGNNAASLIVTRTGEDLGQALSVHLTSSDTTELRVPESVVIPANVSSVKVPVEAIDDALLDGNVGVSLTASAAGLKPDTIDLIAKDREQIGANFSRKVLSEGQASGVKVTVVRSNTDISNPLVVHIKSNASNQVDGPSKITIPANSKSVTATFVPIDDSVAELTDILQYTFTASGYVSAIASFELQDDEPPAFQNQEDPHDVTGGDGVRASDALRIINEIARRTDPLLDPGTETLDGVFPDVNGDYLVTALDALIVINELPYRDANGERIIEQEPFEPVSDDDDKMLSDTDSTTVSLF